MDGAAEAGAAAAGGTVFSYKGHPGHIPPQGNTGDTFSKRPNCSWARKLLYYVVNLTHLIFIILSDLYCNFSVAGGRCRRVKKGCPDSNMGLSE